MYRIFHLVVVSSYVFSAATAAALPEDNNGDGCPALTAPLLTNPGPLAQRDLATITSVFSSVSSGISDLETAVQALNGPNDLPALQSASSRLLEAINTGTSSITSSGSASGGGGSLSLQDAIKLQQDVIASIESKGEQLATTLADKKPTIQRLGLCEIFATQAGEIADGSKKLSEAVVAQVPEQARQIAQQMAAGFTETLDKTKALFAKGSCVNGGGSTAGNGSLSGNGTGTGTGTVVTAAAASNFGGEGGFIRGLVGLAMAGFFFVL